MKIFILTLLIFIIVSCGCYKTNNNSYINNETGENFSIQHFKKGKVQDLLTLTFSKGEKKLVTTLYSAGESENPYLYNYLDFIHEIDSPVVDSVKIIFSNQKSLTYYNKGVSGNNSNAFSFDDKRNLFNGDNWIKDSDKYGSNFTFTYTKEDYLLAK